MSRGQACPFVTSRVQARRKVQCPLGSAVFSQNAWEAIAGSLQLSGRELQIVRGVFDDHTEPAIASDLGISPHTVHTHFERLHRKLAVSDRAQLLVRVMQEFLALTASSKNHLPPICAKHESNCCPFSP